MAWANEVSHSHWAPLAVDQVARSAVIAILRDVDLAFIRRRAGNGEQRAEGLVIFNGWMAHELCNPRAHALAGARKVPLFVGDPEWSLVFGLWAGEQRPNTECAPVEI